MKNHYEIGSVVFGKWSIARRIGAGSFGTVYEIRREEFGQTYTAALKVITVPQNETELQDALDEGMTQGQAEDYFYTMVKDIVREFAIMARLKGTGNVVSYEDHEDVPHDDGMGWDILIRMELLNPLMPYAYDHPLSRRDVIRLGIDMCKALELCQRYNIIHRDIKPENIFVSDNGDFKLGDFGIARTIERTMSGLSKKGTYNYMAPEVYRGGEYGFSVDIYSLGIVLYRLLNNNRAPFLPQPPEPITYTQRETALAKRMGGEELPPPVNGRGRLGEIVLKACAFDPKARYSSPVQMRQELEAIQYGPEDGQIIYPSGDELALYENQYASRRSQAENSAPEPFAAPVPVAAEVTEKTESVFGGGAANSPAPEKAPEKVPEEFFTPAGGEPEEFWPGEATERTEFIFRSDRPEPEPEPSYEPEPEFAPEPEWNEWEPDPADFAPDPGEGQAEGTKKRRWIAYCMAFIATIAILIPLSLRKPAKSEIPESLQEYEAAGALDRVYSDDGKLKAYAFTFLDSEGNLSYEEIYDLQGQLKQKTYYNSDGTIAFIVEPEYDNEGKLTKTVQHDADGNMLSYTLFEYDAGGNETRRTYKADGSLSTVLELDSDGNLMRSETYDADGKLAGTETYDENGNVTDTEPYGESGNIIEVTNTSWYGYDYDYVDAWVDYGGAVATLNIQRSDGSAGFDTLGGYDVSIRGADREELPDPENLLFRWSSDQSGLIACELNATAFEAGYYEICIGIPDSNGDQVAKIDVSICVGGIGTIVNAGPIGFGWEDLVLQNRGTGGCLSFDGTDLSMNDGDIDGSSIWHMNYEWINDGYNSIYCSAFGSDRILDVDNAGVFDGNLVKVWTRTGYDVQYWDTIRVHVMGQGYGMGTMIVNMETDGSGEEYCLAWDSQKNAAVIRPVSQVDEYCVWDILSPDSFSGG